MPGQWSRMGPMHGKERQVAPAFADTLGAHVFAPDGIDTNQFGTAEVARPLAPMATARLTGLPLPHS